MEPCDAHFLAWWQSWQRIHAGIATPRDLIIAKVNWEVSMALQRKLGAIDDG